MNVAFWTLKKNNKSVNKINVIYIYYNTSKTKTTNFNVIIIGMPAIKIIIYTNYICYNLSKIYIKYLRNFSYQNGYLDFFLSNLSIYIHKNKSYLNDPTSDHTPLILKI